MHLPKGSKDKHEGVVTCISGSIPFPKTVANKDMEIKALKSLAEVEDSKE